MDKLDQEAQTRQTVAFVLLGLVTLGWMAGVAFGFALAITSVAVVLTAITRRIQIRAHVLSEALPRLLTTN